MSDIENFDLARVREKAEALARLERNMTWRGMSSAPFDPDSRVRSDASYKLLGEALSKARREYEEAIRGLTAEQLQMAAEYVPPTEEPK
jgi:hypothetical protein